MVLKRNVTNSQHDVTCVIVFGIWDKKSVYVWVQKIGLQIGLPIRETKNTLSFPSMVDKTGKEPVGTSKSLLTELQEAGGDKHKGQMTPKRKERDDVSDDDVTWRQSMIQGMKAILGLTPTFIKKTTFI